MSSGAVARGAPTSRVRGADRPVPGSLLARSEMKLRPPPLRDGIVDRKVLVDRLAASTHADVVTIVAPAGYGKTTLMAQWRQRESRPAAWLSVDHEDNDPVTLLRNVTAALRRVGLLAASPDGDDFTAAGTTMTHGVPRIARELASQQRRGVLMLDHVETLRHRASIDVVAEMAARLPPTMQLALASRIRLRLPVPLLRSQGRLVELTAADLAMDDREGQALLESAGVDAGPDLPAVVARTEGWPVGLYLAALAVKAGAPRDSALQVGGDDRFLADYLRHEVLGRLSDSKVAFLTRTSVLERFSGSMCDAVLERTGSARLLESLEGSNLLIVPLDRTREWYRYHHLFRELLTSELARREPDSVAGLHSRAADWCEANGMAEMAIDHAMAASDVEGVARLIGRFGRSTYAAGRVDTVFKWFTWFDDHGGFGRYPTVAALGGWLAALSGDPQRATRWAASVLPADTDDTPAPAGEAAAPTLLLRAFLCRWGAERMLADATTGRAAIDAASEWQAAALVLEGVALLLNGREDEADRTFAESAAVGERFGAAPSATLALAERSVIAIARDDWHLAEELAQHSISLMRRSRLEGYATSALGLAVAARTTLRRGDIESARRLVGEAAMARPLLSAALPHISVQTLLELARTYIELADLGGARRMVREAGDIVALHPDLGTLPARLEELRAHLATLPVGAVGVSSLTSAELRLLPLLVTHLSFPEIGDRLFVSRHTVKTQAMSIYRKLGVSSRSEAVARARHTGLLPG